MPRTRALRRPSAAVTTLFACAALSGALSSPVVPSRALAQQPGVGGVSGSGMGQGEARISARSDVRLSMESLPGTGGSTMSALGARVGGRMAQIRACYEGVVRERPTVTGRLRLRFALPARGRPDVAVESDGVNDRELVRCITRELERVDCESIHRPAGAVVQLEMGNTAAAGVAESERRGQERRQVEVTVDGDGNASATGGNPSRGVRFTVTGRGRESAPAVVAAHRHLTTALPGLTDCRRRAARREQDPSGEVRVVLQVRAGRPVASQVTRSTVAEERTRTCVSRVLRRVERRAEAGSGRVEARIEYSITADE